MKVLPTMRDAARSGVDRAATGRFALLMVLFCGAALATSWADGATWQSITPTNDPPPARSDAAMVYDRERDRIVLFGGRAGATEFDDTWAFDLTTRLWQPLATGTATRPTPRFSVVAGIDGEQDRLIVATGQGGGGFFNDVWSFDLVTNSWAAIAPVGTRPSERYGSAGGTFDPGGFTGGESSLYLTHGFTFAGRFDDSWLFDGSFESWSDQTPVGPLPLKRCLHGGAMVSATELVIFGGCASGFGPCPLDDTWRFDDASDTWTELGQMVRPPARFFPSLVRMGDGRDLLLFGGWGSANLNDLWRLDGTTGQWMQLNPAGAPPPARQSASMVWVDSPDRSLTGGGCGFAVVFGGLGSTERNDLWMLAPESAPQPPSIHAERDLTGVRFVWDHDPDNLGYEVWGSDDPRFDTAGPGLLLLPGTPMIEGTTVSYADQDPVLPNPIRYYLVRLTACEF